jgi:phospholipase A1
VVIRSSILHATLLLITTTALGSTRAEASTALAECYSNSVRDLAEDTTVAQIRAHCEQQASEIQSKDRGLPAYEQSALEERIAATERTEGRPFVLTAHKPNYLMITRMSEPNHAPYIDSTGVADPLNHTELKFQVSVKAPIWRDMFDSKADLYFAYTSTSWWQTFNSDLSLPFRETNYEPELFVRGIADSKFLGMRLATWQLGFNHQSNGRSQPLSRGWNRILGKANLELSKNLALQVRAWYQIPQSEDYNAGLRTHSYLGYGDVRAVWTPKRSTFTAMVRPTSKKTNFELTWSYPLGRVFRVYAQYYRGYGESLIDMDWDTERFGVGFALNDFLMH